jgi:hypothetical protein
MCAVTDRSELTNGILYYKGVELNIKLRFSLCKGKRIKNSFSQQILVKTFILKFVELHQVVCAMK